MPAEITVVEVVESQVTVIQTATAAIRYPAFDNAVSPLMYDYVSATLTIDEEALSDLVVGFTQYVHVQSSSSFTWVVNHNLGHYPGGVTVVDSAGSVLIADIQYVSVNQLTVSFSAALTGQVFVS